jgi:hypothetical protein
VGPRAGLDVCEKFSPTGIRSPDRPVRKQSLYRLSDPGPFGKDRHEIYTLSIRAGTYQVIKVPTRIITNTHKHTQYKNLGLRVLIFYHVNKLRPMK